MASSDQAPNTKYVQVPHEVPREPEQYRSTIHFGQRLRERVPEDSRDRVVRECITQGRVRGENARQPTDEDDVRQFFSFERRVDDVEYRLVVGLRDEAFYDDSKQHLAITITTGGDDA